MLTINGVANLYGSSARKLKCFESTAVASSILGEGTGDLY